MMQLIVQALLSAAKSDWHAQLNVCCCMGCKLSDTLLYADLLNVFETFLPQLLLYPNPTDPLNGEAAALLMREPEAYNAKVKGEARTAQLCTKILTQLCKKIVLVFAALVALACSYRFPG